MDLITPKISLKDLLSIVEWCDYICICDDCGAEVYTGTTQEIPKEILEECEEYPVYRIYVRDSILDICLDGYVSQKSKEFYNYITCHKDASIL